MHKQEIKPGFSLTFPAVEEEKGFTGRFLTAFLLYLGLSGCLWNTFLLAGSGAGPFFLLIAGALYCAASCSPSQKWRFTSFAAAIVLAIYAVAASRFIVEGWSVALNRIFMTLESYLGRIFPRYQVSADANQPLCATLFLVLPSVILAVLCGRAAAAGRAWRYAIFTFVAALWAAALVFRAQAPLVYVAALTAASAALVGRRLTLRNRIPDGGRMTLLLLTLTAGLTLIAALPALALSGAGETGADAARQAASQKIHELRYGGEHQTLPEGDFKKIGDFVPAEDTALYATLEEPGEYYLRSFVGEVYAGDGWTTLTAERKAEFATLFSWLHEREFYGQNQYALLTKALGVTGRTKELQIENVGACTAYLYAPYETVGSKPDKARIGDENLLAGGLRGESEYTFLVSDGSVSDYEQLYQTLTAARKRNDPAAIDYLISENAYREFVYANYLEVPEETREAIEKFLVGLQLPEGKISFSDAQMIVNAYLSSKVSYMDGPEPDYTGNNLLTYVLEDSREGNSIHFATAATLIFRYLGVPARYVEGYRLTQRGTEAAGIGEPVPISGKDACAWTEIYRDGIGFVPFKLVLPEMTPLDQSIQNQDNDELPPEESPEQPDSLWELLGWPLAVVLFLLLLSLLFLAARRAVKRRRLNKFLGIADNAEAVNRMTAYLMRLLSHMDILRENGSLYLLWPALEKKLGQELGATYAAVIRIQQAALFSGRPVADGDRARVRAFLNEIVGQLQKRSDTIMRFRLRWIECIL